MTVPIAAPADEIPGPVASAADDSLLEDRRSRKQLQQRLKKKPSRPLLSPRGPPNQRVSAHLHDYFSHEAAQADVDDDDDDDDDDDNGGGGGGGDGGDDCHNNHNPDYQTPQQRRRRRRCASRR